MVSKEKVRAVGIIRVGRGEGAWLGRRIDTSLLHLYRHGPGAEPDIRTQEILEVHGPCGRDTFTRSQEGEALLSQLTELLGRMQAGDSGARDALFAAAYAELHRLARARLRQGARDVVLDTTCLVHESYLRFVSAGELRAEDRRAFFAYASQVMRSVIVNAARERIAVKRGGDRSHLTLSTKISASVAEGNETVLKVHEALEELEQAEPRLAQVAQMRYFGGYSEQEIAETLDITERTVQRDWEKARLILAETLR